MFDQKIFFVPDIDQIEQLIADYKVPLQPILKWKIDPKQAVTPLNDHFMCTVCLNVVD